MIHRLHRPVDSEPRGVARLRNDVKVNVRNRLVCARSVVFEHVVLADAGDFDHGPADARQHSTQGGGGLIRERIESRGRLLRDDQRVTGAERIDVEEREDLLVLVHLVTGDLAANDLAEDGLCHGGLAQWGRGLIVAQARAHGDGRRAGPDCSVRAYGVHGKMFRIGTVAPAGMPGCVHPYGSRIACR